MVIPIGMPITVVASMAIMNEPLLRTPHLPGNFSTVRTTAINSPIRKRIKVGEFKVARLIFAPDRAELSGVKWIIPMSTSPT